MGEEKQHIPAAELWGYISGTANLTQNQFEHLLLCLECQWLMDEFTDVLHCLPPTIPSLAA